MTNNKIITLKDNKQTVTAITITITTMTTITNMNNNRQTMTNKSNNDHHCYMTIKAMPIKKITATSEK